MLLFYFSGRCIFVTLPCLVSPSANTGRSDASHKDNIPSLITVSRLKHFFPCTERYCVFQCLGNLYCHPLRMQWEIDNNNISSNYFRYKFRTVVPMNYSFDPHPIFHHFNKEFYIFTSLFGKYFYHVSQDKFIFPHIFKHHGQITQIFLIVRQLPEGWRNCGRTFSIFLEETIFLISPYINILTPIEKITQSSPQFQMGRVD